MMVLFVATCSLTTKEKHMKFVLAVALVLVAMLAVLGKSILLSSFTQRCRVVELQLLSLTQSDTA